MGYEVELLVLIAVMVVLVIVVIIEMRILRKRREKRSKKEPLGDQAFNAILNARAISNILARDGTNLSSVNGILDRADQALKRGDSRGSLELTEQAKEMMKGVKMKSDQSTVPSEGGGFVETEPTTKELLKDKFPDNYLETKFSRSLASEGIEKAKRAKLDISEAERLLGLCDDCASQEDYAQALSYAIQAKKVAEDAMSEVKPAEAEDVQGSQTCSSCGADIAPGDAFCRKCGIKTLEVCEDCGKQPEEGDTFCRSCGSPLES
jgi:ribosomal protein L40E